MNTPPALDRFLVGLEFPVSKDAIIAHARSLGADELIVTMLGMLPSTTYKTTADILDAMNRNMPVEFSQDEDPDEESMPREDELLE